jgi:zinc transporter ZupT
MSFAAGAMIYVVVEELIPESQTNSKKELMALLRLSVFRYDAARPRTGISLAFKNE